MTKWSANTTEMSGEKDKTLLYGGSSTAEAHQRSAYRCERVTQTDSKRKGWRRSVKARTEHLNKWEKSNGKRQTVKRQKETPIHPSNIEHVWDMWERFQKPGRPENPYQKDAQRGEVDFRMQQMRSHLQIWKLGKKPQEDMRGRQEQGRWNQDMWQMRQNPTSPKHGPPQKMNCKGNRVPEQEATQQHHQHTASTNRNGLYVRGLTRRNPRQT